MVADSGMVPPVALLVYVPDNPRLAAFYPEAPFSPEWVAMRWALAAGIPTRLVDLPAGTRFALEQGAAEGEPVPSLVAVSGLVAYTVYAMRVDAVTTPII